MIDSIVNIFRKQAREHKAIKAFYYNRNYELGSGNEQHPIFWLEDPIVGHNQANTFINSVNFAILFIPSDETEVLKFQNLAFSVGLNILERIKSDRDSEITIQPTWSYVTLRSYYDNDACGCRFSVDFTQRNMQNLCLIEEQFDADKEFEVRSLLPEFDVTPSGNCEVFVNKLPVFDLKTRK